jgi:hypothetical protein
MARAGIDPPFPAGVGAEDGGGQKTKGCLMKKTLLILVLLLVPTACQTTTLRNPNTNKTVKCYNFGPLGGSEKDSTTRKTCTQSYRDMGYVEEVD